MDQITEVVVVYGFGVYFHGKVNLHLAYLSAVVLEQTKAHLLYHCKHTHLVSLLKLEPKLTLLYLDQLLATKANM